MNNKSYYIDGSKSQANQESFVINVLNYKKNGFYVELGAGWPEYNSNTYLLETKFNWTGVSFENDVGRYHNFILERKNQCLCVDARNFDYQKYFITHNFPQQIDYLQMDIHPACDTLKALKNIPLNNYRFSVITYEHNGYIDDFHMGIKMESQDIFKSLGYALVVNNLTYNGKAYEDWWVDPSVIDYSRYKDFISSDIDCNILLNKIS